MNVKYIIPFVDSAYEVLQTEANFKMKRGPLALDKGTYITDDITVIISLVGDIIGSVFYSMSSQTTLNIVSVILGEQLPELDTLAQSGIAELGNVITGRASVKLSQSGFETTISPPTLMIGKGALISTLDIPRLVVPLEGEPGALTIHLALVESPTKGISSARLNVHAAPVIKLK